MTAVAAWQDYVQNIYTLRNSAMGEIAALQSLIAAAATNLKPNYNVSMPEGAQSFDWAGELAALNASLDVQMGVVERCNKLIEKFPFQLTSRGV